MLNENRLCVSVIGDVLTLLKTSDDVTEHCHVVLTVMFTYVASISCVFMNIVHPDTV